MNACKKGAAVLARQYKTLYSSLREQSSELRLVKVVSRHTCSKYVIFRIGGIGCVQRNSEVHGV
jgi:hypothetical protein